MPRAELPQLYACLDAVLFTSMTQFETFGIVNIVRIDCSVALGCVQVVAFELCFPWLQEAMAAGIPVIHYGTAGLQDYFVDGFNSVLAKEFSVAATASAVLSVLQNATFAAELSHNARKLVAAVFNPEREATRLAELLRCGFILSNSVAASCCRGNVAACCNSCSNHACSR